MTAADKLLPLLHGVKRTGPSRWIARCPAHDDKHPSLSLREADDGRLLVHCWGGCAAAEIVGAVGLDLGDMFPPRDNAPGGGTRRERKPWSAADLLTLAAHEAGVAVMVVSDTVHGRRECRRLAPARGGRRPAGRYGGGVPCGPMILRASRPRPRHCAASA